MASPRYDVARAFMQGKEKSNSTGHFQSVKAPLHCVWHCKEAQDWTYKCDDPTIKLPASEVTILYTYSVQLAVRMPDGTIYFPTYDGRGRTTDTTIRNLDRKYSQTSTIHQNALRVVLSHPNFGDWK